MQSTSTINERQAELEWLLREFVAESPGHTRRIRGSLDDDTIRSALHALSPARADGYFDWLKVGMALHSQSPALLPEWDAWSRQSSKYADGICAEKWRSFNGKGVGAGSLIHWAKQDGWKPPKHIAGQPGRADGGWGSYDGLPDENGVHPICSPKGCTDAMNARRFAVRFAPKVRHCEPWGKFLTWDEDRWKIDDSRQIDAYAKQVGRSLWKEAEAIRQELDPDEDKGAIKAMTAFCQRSNSDHGLRSMIALSRSEPGIPVSPTMLDQDPWLFNVRNGTIDLRTGKLRPHNPEDYITKLSPVEFQEGADSSLWREFLEVILPSQDLRGFLQRLAGYCLTGSTREHVFPFPYGGGSNGKSTFLNTLLALFGTDYAIEAPADLLLAKKNEAHPTELADLFGRRLVVCMEAEDGRRMAESLVKKLTGGDRIRARRMREDFWEFAATHKIWLGANHKPQVRGTDHGIWRRIKLIPFTVTISDADQDKDLPEKLLGELPGILNWALQGCMDWQQHGLGEPEAVKEATQEYKSEMDVMGEFIAERCIEGHGLIELASDLYHAYAEWITGRGERPVSQTRFGTQLETRGFQKDRDSSSGKIMRLGIRLRKSEISAPKCVSGYGPEERSF